MADPASGTSMSLLDVFDATFKKIMLDGHLHWGISDLHVKSMTHVAAFSLDDGSRVLGRIDGNGAIKDFAMVNGKGYVETRGGIDQATMEKALQKHGDHIARTVPCRPDEPLMHHYSGRPPAKVFG